MPEITTPAISKPIPTTGYTFAAPAHTATSLNARESFDHTVDRFTQGGRQLGAHVAGLPTFVAHVAVGQRSAVNGAAHANFTWNEGAVGNLLITAQTILAEAGAIIGAVAGVLVAGGKTVVGQPTTGTVAAHRAAGKNLGSLAAHVVTAPASVALDWTRFIIGEAIKILPAVGAVVGGSVGTAIGSITGVLAGLGTILNIGATPIDTSAPSAATGATTAGV